MTNDPKHQAWWTVVRLFGTRQVKANLYKDEVIMLAEGGGTLEEALDVLADVAERLWGGRLSLSPRVAAEAASARLRASGTRV